MTTNPEETTNPADLDTAEDSILSDELNDAQTTADDARRDQDPQAQAVASDVNIDEPTQ